MLLCIPPCFAERADRDKPIHLEADQVRIDDAQQISTFIGNVKLSQGTLLIRGDKIVVTQDQDGFKHGTAYGNTASFRQKREGFDEYIEGWAERIEYDGRADKVQMFTRAAMKRGQDEVRGDYISYDATTEFFQVIGGGAKAASPNNPDGRVRAVMQPKSREKPPASPPVTLKPATDLAAPREEPGAAKK